MDPVTAAPATRHGALARLRDAALHSALRRYLKAARHASDGFGVGEELLRRRQIDHDRLEHTRRSHLASRANVEQLLRRDRADLADAMSRLASATRGLSVLQERAEQEEIERQQLRIDEIERRVAELSLTIANHEAYLRDVTRHVEAAEMDAKVSEAALDEMRVRFNGLRLRVQHTRRSGHAPDRPATASASLAPVEFS